MDETSRRQLDADVAGCAAAHQTLNTFLNDLLERGQLDPTAPSLLTDWTVGHVLTHLARNAEAFANIIVGAALGESRPMYASVEARNEAIERGSTRSAEEIVTDIRVATWALEGAWAKLDAAGWGRSGTNVLGPIPVVEIPSRRWREVEVHHADLGLGFGPTNWSAGFIEMGTAQRQAELASRSIVVPDDVAAAPAWQRLAWLLGRETGLLSPAPAW